MTYTNSSLVSYTKLSPNHSGQRTHSIDRITPHCVVGQCSVETLGNIFLPTSRQASCNYGIGVDGRVGMYVEEKNRSWCSSSSANDQRAVTIECASDTTEPYAFKDVVYQTLIKLCVDICKRNGKKKLLWLGDKDKTLSYEPKSDEMVLTVHRWFANKSCPGSWMYARMGDLAAKVTAQLGGGASEGTETEYPEKLTEGYYRVRKAWSDSKSQKGAYKILSNAKKCADANPGYSVFDNNGVNIYTPNTSTQTAPDVPFTVKVSISDLNIRKGPGTDYAKELIENQYLEAVISMPSGVFKPYAGVSTAILIFTKTNGTGTDKVWFYDMKADGYSLDDKRQPVQENDIPDIIERFHKKENEEDRERTEQSFMVDKQEIIDNGYDLSINKYKKIEYVPVEYPPTEEILAEIEELNEEITKETAELRALLRK